VHDQGGTSYVFAVRDGKLERRAVSLGRGIASDVEVVAGVNAGDELVVSGPENLRDNEKVEARARE
jgi:membrane fusion protein (multidrug efflux system)